MSTDASDATNAPAAQLAIQRLNEVDTVRATLNDDDQLHLDISNLVGGDMVTMKFLVRHLALARGTDEHEVIADTREFLDNVEQAPHRTRTSGVGAPCHAVTASDHHSHGGDKDSAPRPDTTTTRTSRRPAASSASRRHPLPRADHHARSSTRINDPSPSRPHERPGLTRKGG